MEARTANKLNTGDRFPEISLTLVGGRSIHFPTEAEGRYRIRRAPRSAEEVIRCVLGGIY